MCAREKPDETTALALLGDDWLFVAAVGLVLFVVVLSGFVGLVADEDELGDGTATVTVVEPTGGQLLLTDGRFGTGAVYLRIPDLVLDVEGVQGQPRVVYRVSVPELGVDEQRTALLTSTGRVRVPVEDRAFESVANETYEGRVVVRVQSFTHDHTVLNRSMEVQVR